MYAVVVLNVVVLVVEKLVLSIYAVEVVNVVVLVVANEVLSS